MTVTRLDVSLTHHFCLGLITFVWDSSFLFGTHHFCLGLVTFVWDSSLLFGTRHFCLGLVTFVWDSSLLFGTRHFLQKNNKQCSSGTCDFLVVNQTFILHTWIQQHKYRKTWFSSYRYKLENNYKISCLLTDIYIVKQIINRRLDQF